LQDLDLEIVQSSKVTTTTGSEFTLTMKQRPAVEETVAPKNATARRTQP
jgi:hypothetical protein